MRRLAWLVAVALATLTVLVLLWRFRDVVVLFVFSLAVAAAMRPPIDRLVQRKVPLGLATAAVYLVTVGVFGVVLYAATSRLLVEVQQGSNAFAQAYAHFRSQPPPGQVFALIVAQLPPLSVLYDAVGHGGTPLVLGALGATLGAVDTLSKFVLVLVLSIYWGTDQVHFERLWLSLLPADQRMSARNIWRSIENGVGAYIRSEIAQSLLAGLALSLAFGLLGLPYPVLLATLAAVAWLIPLIGWLLAIIPVGLTALAVNPLLPALGVACTLLAFVVLELFVEPRLFNARRYSSVLIVVVMIAMSDALGLFGLLLGPPLAVALQIFFGELMALPLAAASVRVQTGPELGQIKERLANARELAGSLEEAPAPELASLLERAAALVEQADQAVENERQGPNARLDSIRRLEAAEART